MKTALPKGRKVIIDLFFLFNVYLSIYIYAHI